MMTTLTILYNYTAQVVLATCSTVRAGYCPVAVAQVHSQVKSEARFDVGAEHHSLYVVKELRHDIVV